jgi:hypothetical protein
MHEGAMHGLGPVLLVEPKSGIEFGHERVRLYAYRQRRAGPSVLVKRKRCDLQRCLTLGLQYAFMKMSSFGCAPSPDSFNLHLALQGGGAHGAFT